MLEDLSKSDLIRILDLINESLSCTTEPHLRDLMDKLGFMVPFDFALCGMARLEKSGALASYEVINISYPPKWLELYITQNYHSIDPVIKKTLLNFDMFYWEDAYKTLNPPREFISQAEDFGLKKGYSYRMRRNGNGQGSLFSISSRNMEKDSRAEVILSNLMPHFHQAFERVLGNASPAGYKGAISTRETEVLKWLKCGKSSWDISKILGVSERTINYHVYNIIRKLDAVNRPHAVAVAMERGLIGNE